mmetsp:Transcript_16278/g.31813  ORF Transcript_16278/g.31813 Transcript_16278/m.31813 type:complete len:267 (-) Transcript_16278:187-987(-)
MADRGSLLSSIRSFGKGKLKKTRTKDKSKARGAGSIVGASDSGGSNGDAKKEKRLSFKDRRALLAETISPPMPVVKKPPRRASGASLPTKRPGVSKQKQHGVAVPNRNPSQTSPPPPMMTTSAARPAVASVVVPPPPAATMPTPGPGFAGAPPPSANMASSPLDAAVPNGFVEKKKKKKKRSSEMEAKASAPPLDDADDLFAGPKTLAPAPPVPAPSSKKKKKKKDRKSSQSQTAASSRAPKMDNRVSSIEALTNPQQGNKKCIIS